MIKSHLNIPGKGTFLNEIEYILNSISEMEKKQKTLDKIIMKKL